MKELISSRPATGAALSILFAVLFILPACPVNGAGDSVQQLDPYIQMELQYAEALTAMGLPDFAEMVLDKLPANIGMQKVVLELQTLLATGQFDEVKKIIARQPNQGGEDVWAMKLTLGDYYYRWGKYKEAKAVYNGFFKQYGSRPPERLLGFYIDSAYKYAQMLMLMDDQKGALKIYDMMLGTQIDRDLERRILAEKAELLIKMAEAASGGERRSYLEKVKSICNDKLFWVPDIWFGKAVVLISHAYMLEGDIKKAMEMIDTYTPQLIKIDESLKREEEETGERVTLLSPMAECRYLLAVMMLKEAKKKLQEGKKEEAFLLLTGVNAQGRKEAAGAIDHFVNVFGKYPGTSWAPDAMFYSEEVKEILAEEFGRTLDIEISAEKLEEVKKFQFSQARVLFNQDQFDEAITAYMKALAMPGEDETTVSGLSELARCYLSLLKEDDGNELYAETIIGYMAEHFAYNQKLMPRTGDELQRLAQFCSERGMLEWRNRIYDIFFKTMTKHPRLPGILYKFGDEAFDQGDFERAMGFYSQILENHKKSNAYRAALFKAAKCYEKLGKLEEQIKALDEYMGILEKKAQPGSPMINAKLSQARAYEKGGALAKAYNIYVEIIKLLTGPDNVKYNAGQKDAEANKTLLEAAMFNRAKCLMRLKGSEEEVQKYHAAAVKALEEFLEEFPESDFSSSVLMTLGISYQSAGEPEKAAKQFDTLKRKYPQSTEAKNVDYYRATGLLEMGKRKEAIKAFQEMFRAGGQYKPVQILFAALELFKAGEYEIALEGFERVLASSSEQAVIERAMLGKGKSLVELGKFDEAVDTLVGMEKDPRFKGSTSLKEVYEYLSTTFANLGSKESNEDKRFELFNNSMKALKRVRKFIPPDNPGARAMTDVRLGEIQELKAEAEKQFGTPDMVELMIGDAIGTYQTLILLGDPNDPGVRKAIEEAYFRCIPLMLKSGMATDAKDNADQYLEKFGSGKYVQDARKWQNEAKIQSITERRTAPQP